MKNRLLFTLLVVLTLCAAQTVLAQPYAGAFVGMNSAGLEGMIKVTSGGSTSTGNVVDAGGTGFTFGLTGGYQVFPKDFADGWYKLDLGLDISYTSVSFFENGYNKQLGSGAFAANGLDGGSTMILSFDIMPIHRLTIPTFKLLAPFVGIGVDLSLMSTGDVTVNPPAGQGTLTGSSDFKVGLLIFYGVVVRASDTFYPYLQFKHQIPFSDEMQFTEEYQAAGGGSQSVAYFIQDSPSFFCLEAGLRIAF
jgi:hypothetical protein